MDVAESLTPKTPAEMKILSGERLVSVRDAARDEDYLVADWSGCSVRAEFVRALAQSGKAVDIEGAEVTGSLDLSNTKLPVGIKMRRCLFREPVDFSRSSLPSLDLGGSHLLKLEAQNLECDTLRFGDRGIAGPVNLQAANLGHVSFTGLLLSVADTRTVVLDANVVTTSRSADFNGGFEARGRVRFIGASIGGQLNFRRAIFHQALSLHEVSTSRTLYLREGLFKGSVSLAEARIMGRVDARDATFTGGGSNVLNFNGTTVDRAVQLSGAVVHGTIVVRNSTIKGNLRLLQVVVRAPLSVGTPRPPGADWLHEANVSLDLAKQLPGGANAAAFSPEDLWSREPRVDLTNSEVLDGEVALRIENSRISSGLLLQAGAVYGAVQISGTTVEGSIDLRWSHLRNPGKVVLRITESTVGATLRLRELASFEGCLDLSRLNLGRLDDDVDVWKAAAGYDLRGLTYQTVNLDRPAWSLPARLDWLAGQSPFSPQPYEQFAGLLLRNGRRQEAWRVFQAESSIRRTAAGLNPFARAGSLISGLVVGHGYRPERALYVLVLLMLLCWPVYEIAWAAGAVKPADSEATVSGRCTSSGDCFVPWAYSLENALPFLGLKGREAWRLDDRVGIYSNVVDIQVAAGWILATAGVAGLTRRTVKT